MRKTLYNIKITKQTEFITNHWLIKGTNKQGTKVYAALVNLDIPYEEVKRMAEDTELKYYPYDESTNRLFM